MARASSDWKPEWSSCARTQQSDSTYTGAIWNLEQSDSWRSALNEFNSAARYRFGHSRLLFASPSRMSDRWMDAGWLRKVMDLVGGDNVAHDISLVIYIECISLSQWKLIWLAGRGEENDGSRLELSWVVLVWKAWQNVRGKFGGINFPIKLWLDSFTVLL